MADYDTSYLTEEGSHALPPLPPPQTKRRVSGLVWTLCTFYSRTNLLAAVIWLVGAIVAIAVFDTVQNSISVELPDDLNPNAENFQLIFYFVLLLPGLARLVTSIVYSNALKYRSRTLVLVAALITLPINLVVGSALLFGEYSDASVEINDFPVTGKIWGVFLLYFAVTKLYMISRVIVLKKVNPLGRTKQF